MKFSDCHPNVKHFCKGLCKNCYQTQYRNKNPKYVEYMKEYSKKYRQEKPEIAKKHQELRKLNPDKVIRDKITFKNCAYKKKYKITLNDAIKLLETQNNECALCKKHLNDKTMRVDHCHKNGNVRGILCNTCNTGLGYLGDSVESLQRALNYLHQSMPTGMNVEQKSMPAGTPQPIDCGE
jgi:Recombination endonuclease VII